MPRTNQWTDAQYAAAGYVPLKIRVKREVKAKLLELVEAARLDDPKTPTSQAKIISALILVKKTKSRRLVK